MLKTDHRSQSGRPVVASISSSAVIYLTVHPSYLSLNGSMLLLLLAGYRWLVAVDPIQMSVCSLV